jgi:hypothetical protein
MLWEYDGVDVSQAPNIGNSVKEGDVIGFLQTPYGVEPIKTAFSGKVIATYVQQGDWIAKGEIVAFVE